MCRVVYHDDDTFLERKLNDDLKCQMNQSETVSQIKVYLYAELSVLQKIWVLKSLKLTCGFDQVDATRKKNYIFNYFTCNF
mmetsp:Transcript_13436/g.23870  ORF Transcript_13436/g.23870 Transcript_13436/m.23870 type:complete len:81 (-) Transcript_13436:31-273(-)